MIFRARLIADSCTNLPDQFWIPGGCQPNRLGKDGGLPVARDAVQAFVPVVVGRNAQAGYSRGAIGHLADFFCQGHLRQQILDALVER